MFPLQSAKPLVQKLGGLPLAIKQVAAYISQTGVHVEEYHATLGSLTKSLFTETELNVFFDRGQKGPGALTEAKVKPVIATWEISLKNVEKQHRGVSDLLNSFAFLSDNEVSVDFLSQGGNGAFEGRMQPGIFPFPCDLNIIYDYC
jgi:hypothetical protein